MNISSLWPTVFCCLREDLIYGEVEAVGRKNRSIGSFHKGHAPKIVVSDNGER